MIRHWKTQILNFTRKQLFQNSLAENTFRTFTHGRNADDLVCRLVPNHYQYQTPSVRTVRNGKGLLELDLSDFMEWHYYYDFYDPSLDNLLKLTEKGDHVLDIGANIGAMSLKLAEKVGGEGQVLAFEPDPQRFKKCRRQVELSGQSHLSCYPLALGDHAESRNLRVRNSLNQGMNQIVPEGEAAPGAISVNVTTVDQFLKEHPLPALDLIKIDVEGFEFKVLAGSEATLNRFKPTLFVEIDSRNLSEHGNSAPQVFQFLDRLGYELYANEIGTSLHTISAEKCHFDLVAIPKPI